MDTTSAVRAEQLTKVFNGSAGVVGIDLEVATGTIFGLIGPSGSGKTTTVRLMAGLLSPSSGVVEVFGEKPTDFKRQTRARLGYMPQDSVLYPSLTLRQNLDFSGSLFGLHKGKRERIDTLIEFVELEGAADRLPAASSGGEKRRIALASTLIHRPELVFLDEPTAGLDPVLRKKFWDRFEDLARSGRTLVVTTQYVGEAAYCDYVAVLAGGRVLTVDTPEGLRHQAFGGDLIDVIFTDQPSSAALEFLKKVSGTGDPEWIDDHTVRVVVDDPGAAITRILEWGNEHQVGIEKADGYAPPFDDIFVELVERLSKDQQGFADREPEAV